MFMLDIECSECELVESVFKLQARIEMVHKNKSEQSTGIFTPSYPSSSGSPSDLERCLQLSDPCGLITMKAEAVVNRRRRRCPAHQFGGKSQARTGIPARVPLQSQKSRV